MDLIIALTKLSPGKEFHIPGDQVYANIESLDGSPIPSEAEINAKIAELQSERATELFLRERDKRLSESDWTQLIDSPLNALLQTEWQTYRQALRALPASTNPTLDANYELDESSVTWPTEPA